MSTAVGWESAVRPDFGVTRASLVLLLGNLADALITLTLLQLGLAQELNPLMRWAYQGSPLLFMMSKLTIVHLSLILLCLHRGSRAARVAEAFAGGFYAAIVSYQLVCLCRL